MVVRDRGPGDADRDGPVLPGSGVGDGVDVTVAGAEALAGGVRPRDDGAGVGHRPPVGDVARGRGAGQGGRGHEEGRADRPPRPRRPGRCDGRSRDTAQGPTAPERQPAEDSETEQRQQHRDRGLRDDGAGAAVARREGRRRRSPGRRWPPGSPRWGRCSVHPRLRHRLELEHAHVRQRRAEDGEAVPALVRRGVDARGRWPRSAGCCAPGRRSPGTSGRVPEMSTKFSPPSVDLYRCPVPILEMSSASEPGGIHRRP